MSKPTGCRKKIVQNVRALPAVMEEMGNPFEEESTDLLVLDTQEILGPAAVESVRTAVSDGARSNFLKLIFNQYAIIKVLTDLSGL